jgi:predicted DNA binding CopG/RHH family protein
MRAVDRDNRITIRISVPLREALESAATAAGLELAEHCRRILIADCRRRMKRKASHETIQHQTDGS